MDGNDRCLNFVLLSMKKMIITGGPGSGKTSLIEALQALGYSCSPEASRQLIVEEVAKKSDCLPWINLNRFADLALDRMIDLYRDSSHSELTFFDRGIPDIIAYLTCAGQPVAAKYAAALHSCHYDTKVFILPPWKEIYVNDEERWQTFEESVALHNAIKNTYEKLNFNLLEVPKSSIQERVSFVLSNLTTR
jgi:predicted ATPase